jgi:uncharacterized membrane protein
MPAGRQTSARRSRAGEGTAHGASGGARPGQPRGPERVFDLAGDLAKQELLQLEDAAYAYRDDKGKVRIHQAVSLTAAGAASGALGGELAHVGINDDTIKRIGAQLQGGKAAVFLLARSATVDRVIEAIKPYNPTVIQTNLSHDREEELVRALQP